MYIDTDTRTYIKQLYTNWKMETLTESVSTLEDERLLSAFTAGIQQGGQFRTVDAETYQAYLENQKKERGNL